MKHKLVRLGLVLSGLIGVVVFWSFAQPANEAASGAGAAQANQTPMDPALRRELARLAITQPAAFEAEMNKVKTAEDFTAEKIAAFAILNPEAYTAEADRFKTDDQRAAEALSLMAVLEPKKYNAALEPLKTQEQKEQEAQSAFAILHPQFKSRSVPGPNNAKAAPQP